MSSKTKKTIGWVLTALVSFIFIGSAIGKLSGSADALKMASSFGLDECAFKAIGIVELISVILFIYPRTGVIGTLLLAAYMGGAIATHLEHGESIVAPSVIAAFVWAVAFYRFPELTSRILGYTS